jgi:hypothetical protein
LEDIVKKRIFRALGMTVLVWGAAVIAVNTKGAASCVPQVGFSALVQKALFAPAASCLAGNTDGGHCASPGGSCTINSSLSPGNGTPGKCNSTPVGCACVPNAAP